jgi:hypothetical protein
MPKKKQFTAQLLSADSIGNVPMQSDDLPATPKEPAKPFDPAQVPQFIQSLHAALAPKGRWSSKKPEWIKKLLLYTIDGLTATIAAMQESMGAKPKKTTRKRKSHDA